MTRISQGRKISANFKTLVVRSPFVDPRDGFARLAGDCAAAGVTHLTFTEIEPSHWEIDDPRDPYLHWSIVHTSLLKVFPPDLLSAWVPRDYAERAQASIAARAAILKEAGLKGAAFLYDPMYWPEGVFREHPELRGPRTDNPGQCIHPRFSPCVDHPEVLAFYRRGFQQLYELSAGVLDIIVMRTNDSGTGFCWTALYNGRNGPTACKSISHQARTHRFLEECLAGIREAGGKTRMFLGGGSIAGEHPPAFAAQLPPGTGVYGHNRADVGGERVLSGFPTDFSLYPIRGIPNPLETLKRLGHAHARGWPELIFFTCPTMYGNDWRGDLSILRTLAHFLREPRTRLLETIELARDVAEEMYGQENAADIVESWSAIARAAEILQKSTIGMADLIFYGSMAQRWLTRPLVAYPDRLTAEEKAHYQPWLYQANGVHDSTDLLNQSAVRQFDGLRHLGYFNKHFDEACRQYRTARACVHRVRERNGPRAEELTFRLAALELLDGFLCNIRNCINFQLQLEAVITKRAAVDAGGDALAAGMKPGLWGGRIALAEIARAEIDNSLALARQIEQNPDLLELAGSRAEETPFMLGPKLAADLRRKAQIMTIRLGDIDELTRFTAG